MSRRRWTIDSLNNFRGLQLASSVQVWIILKLPIIQLKSLDFNFPALIALTWNAKLGLRSSRGSHWELLDGSANAHEQTNAICTFRWRNFLCLQKFIGLGWLNVNWMSNLNGSSLISSFFTFEFNVFYVNIFYDLILLLVASPFSLKLTKMFAALSDCTDGKKRQ